MKKLFLLAILLASQTFCFAQKKAITETGEEVLLFDDGRWKYANGDTPDEPEPIKINKKEFVKPDKSSFLLKSNKLNVGLWLDPKQWKFGKAVSNQMAEYELQMKEKDLYAMVLTEKIEIPLENLKNIALTNARKVAPDIEIVKEEYRTVNKQKVLCMQMNGTTQGIKFSYYGYYFSSPKGTVQLVTYTSQNLMYGYINEAEDLLNGFVQLD